MLARSPADRSWSPRFPSRVRSRRVGAPIVLILFLTTSCGDDRSPTPPHEPLPVGTSCDDPWGTEYSGTVEGPVIWEAEGGPHRLVADVTIEGDLTLREGALVCGAPGARLTVTGDLTMTGTPADPVILTAEDPSQPWGFIAGLGNISLSHVRVEDSLGDVSATVPADGGPATDTLSLSVSRSEFRRIRGPAVSLSGVLRGRSSVRYTVIDSACLECGSAAISTTRYSNITLEENEILNSGGGGVAIGDRSRVSLLGGRIEGSEGIGLVAGGLTVRGLSLTETRPIRITGGASYPAKVPLGVAREMLKTAEAHEQWTGNAKDTVLLGPGPVSLPDGRPPGPATVRPGLVWVLVARGLPHGGLARLNLMPGAELVFRGREGGLRAGSVQAMGTAEAPVSIRGEAGLLRLTGSPDEISRFEHVHFDDVTLWLQEEHPAILEEVEAEDVSIWIQAPGTRLTGAILHGDSEWRSGEPVQISAPDVEVSLCDVSGSAVGGIEVTAASSVRIRDCNIHGNAGPGLRNEDAEAVDARDNWWGDPEGPEGPDGDGVEGEVLYEPFRNEPVEVREGATP